jgi:hypothetical protein
MKNMNNDYTNWENVVTNEIERTLEITHSDAQGLVEANDFVLAQQWSAGTDAKEAARFILIKKAIEL